MHDLPVVKSWTVDALNTGGKHFIADRNGFCVRDAGDTTEFLSRSFQQASRPQRCPLITQLHQLHGAGVLPVCDRLYQTDPPRQLCDATNDGRPMSHLVPFFQTMIGTLVDDDSVATFNRPTPPIPSGVCSGGAIEE